MAVATLVPLEQYLSTPYDPDLFRQPAEHAE
jgi:hypothetical protein